jgi:outer membrane lipoprotein-sorting protein
MRKTLIVPILLLTALILVGAGCGKKAPSEGESATPVEEETRSLTDIFGEAKSITSFKYDMVITAPEQVEITTKMWRKENKMRMEGNFEGRSMVYLVDVGKQVAYVYFPSENMAMKINISKAQEAAGESPTEESESVMKYNPITLGVEVLDGKTCMVIKYTAETDNVKMWVWTKYGLPIRTETTTTQGITVAEMKNIDFGSIPDSMFELPAGAQLMEIPFLGL